MVKNILLATDGSNRSEKAAATAIEVAKCCGASLNVISVVDSGSPRDALDIDPYDIVDDDKDVLIEHDEQKSKPEKAFVERIRQMAKAAGIESATEVRFGDPAEEIIAYAGDSGADLIVVGSHGRGTLSNAVMGSVSTNIVHKGNVPVLVVPSHD